MPIFKKDQKVYQHLLEQELYADFKSIIDPGDICPASCYNSPLKIALGTITEISMIIKIYIAKDFAKIPVASQV